MAIAALVAVPVAAQSTGRPRASHPDHGGGGDRLGRSDHGHLVLRRRADPLGVHDGYGVNAWSVASFAAVRSEAAKCPNVEVIAAGAGGDLQKAISDVNSWVAQGINAIVIIPDAGAPGAQLQSLQDATEQGVTVVPVGLGPARRGRHGLRHLRGLGHHRQRARSGRSGWPTRSAARARSCSWAARQASRSACSSSTASTRSSPTTRTSSC